MYLCAKNIFFRAFSFILSVIIFNCNIAQVYASQSFISDLSSSATAAVENYEALKFVGYKINPQNPLQLEFIVDKGMQKDDFEDEINRNVDYFLAALTTPIDKIWVNLSPYEADRVIESEIELTNMGKDLLAQDYVLKQFAAQLTNPNTELGRLYWKNNSNTSDLNKLWISPDTAEVYDSDNLLVITDSSLKVHSEDANDNVLIPSIRTEVNTGESFARLRQIYNAIILAQTFKAKFYNSLYKQYINHSNTNGIEIDDINAKDRIFSEYVQAFKKGAYNVTKKEYDSNLNRKVKRTYFSGGIEVSSSLEIKVTNDRKKASSVLQKAFKAIINLIAPKKEERVIYDEESIIKYIVDNDNMNIVVADDNATMRLIYKKFLEKLGHNVVVFDDGIPTLEYIKDLVAKDQLDIDLIVTDNDMIDYHGHQLVADIYDELKLTIPCLMQTGTEDKDALAVMKEHEVPVFWPKTALNDALSAEVKKRKSSSAISIDSFMSIKVEALSRELSELDMDDELKTTLAKALNEPVMDFYYVSGRADRTLLYVGNVGEQGFELYVYANEITEELMERDLTALAIASRHNLGLANLKPIYKELTDIKFIDSNFRPGLLNNFSIIGTDDYEKVEKLVASQFAAVDLSEFDLSINIVDALLAGKIQDLRTAIEIRGTSSAEMQDYIIFELIKMISAAKLVDYDEFKVQRALLKNYTALISNRKNVFSFVEDIWNKRDSSEMFILLRDYLTEDKRKSGVFSSPSYDYTKNINLAMDRFFRNLLADLADNDKSFYLNSLGLGFEQWISGFATPVDFIFSLNNNKLEYDSSILSTEELKLSNMETYFKARFDPIEQLLEIDLSANELVLNSDSLKALYEMINFFSESRKEVINSTVTIHFGEALATAIGFERKELKSVDADMILDWLSMRSSSSAIKKTVDIPARVEKLSKNFSKLSFDSLAYEHDLDVALGDMIYKSNYFVLEYAGYRNDKRFALVRHFTEDGVNKIQYYTIDHQNAPETMLKVISGLKYYYDMTGEEKWNVEYKNVLDSSILKFDAVESGNHLLIKIDEEEAQLKPKKQANSVDPEALIASAESSSAVGGITMADFAVVGLKVSSLLDGIRVDDKSFYKINPELVSFSKIDNFELK